MHIILSFGILTLFGFSCGVTGLSTTAPSAGYGPSGWYRPIPPDAAQELEDYFNSKAVVELEALNDMLSNMRSEMQTLTKDVSGTEPRCDYDPFMQPSQLPQEQEHTYRSTSSTSFHALEERVRQLELQLAGLLEHGIPEGIMQNAHDPQNIDTRIIQTEIRDKSIKTIQGIPYFEQPLIQNEHPLSNGWEERLKNELETCQHMRGGQFCNLIQERKIQEKTAAFQLPENTVAIALDPRQKRFVEEMEACQLMKRGALKKELEERGIETKTLLEKSEFVTLLAEARLKEAVEDCAEVKDVEVLTDDGEPWIYQDSHVQEETGIPTGRSDQGFSQGVAVNGCNGDGIPDIQNYGGGGGAHGGTNPFVVAKVRECLANPAAFAKYYSDPDLVAIIRELRQQM